MEKTRTEAEAGGGFFGVTYLVTDNLERFFVGVVHLDVAEEGEIVAAADAVDLCAKNFRAIRIVFMCSGVFIVGEAFYLLVFEKRIFGRSLAAGFVFIALCLLFDLF